ncbi:capsular polysaccharide biosynthesis protein [Amphritea pacifica]|uniref:Capsular polysaccharide biosynthesis protein n=1 Tax=Amphritea pacifica TaxID=2811233 RepID=A0ABS2W5K1_9GAMM|nr:capsular polysaccharide biosynthesis protein [Amphritea pacifica]MBN0986993.1 capsular polysaccharide biosynthesis protein [Amphritea pacifica]
MSCVGVFSGRIFKTPYLSEILDADVVRLGALNKPACDYIAGWGLKPTSVQARRYACRENIPYISLEDGFIRSLELGVDRAPAHSVIADYSGIYYDSSRPSDLETLILSTVFDEELLQRAARCIDLLRYHRLSKYNHVPDIPPACTGQQSRVLVVDQTFGDASVVYGGAGSDTFIRMLDSAIAEHPEAEICVKVHPDVIAGKKKGYLLGAALTRNCVVLSEDISPWALFDTVEHVYVVTSQLGFEALLAGKQVSCFGLPFYSGWGLTNDFLHCERRGVSRSLEQVFAAAYLLYPRYINPYTGQRCELEDTIYLLSDQKRQRDRYRGRWLAVGFSQWKKGFVGRFLGRYARMDFIRRAGSVRQHLTPSTRVLAWASSLSTELSGICASAGIELWRMEDGFVRSTGLGVDRVKPLSLVLDSKGIYYDPSAPSDLENMLNSMDVCRSLTERARRVRQAVVELKLSKYNVGDTLTLSLPETRKIILVPGQVETDASILRGSSSVKTNLELLQRVRNRNPDAYIIYKPHPDVISGGRYGELKASAAASLYDLELKNVSIADVLDSVDEVHTITSLAGFEALLRGVRVFTYGLPFYAGWGLTGDAEASERRQRHLTLDELVAITLIVYPVYIDPVSGDQVNIETVIQILNQSRNSCSGTDIKARLYRVFRNTFLKC